MMLEIENLKLVKPEYAEDLMRHAKKKTKETIEVPDLVYLELKAKHQGHQFVQAMTGWVQQGCPVVSANEQHRRREICERCPHFSGTTCKICGCWVDFKKKLATESCPLGKW
jgi:hypothetical protein